MAKGKGIGLSVLAQIKAEAEDKAKRKAQGKANKGEAEHSPAYSADASERLFANTSVILSKDDEILLKPANTGARRGRAPRLIVEATEAAVDQLCADLKALIKDEALMAEKRASFEEWRNAQKK